MNVFFLSAECYPVAKVGGLADVVGSLPKYLQKISVQTSVVIPGYDMPWFENKLYKIAFSANFYLGSENLYFEVRYYIGDVLGFPFYTINIPGKFDRHGVYAGKNGNYFSDEIVRNIAFQRAFLIWIRDSKVPADIIHCHDHHTGLVPFMMKYCYEFQMLSNIPTVFTIHNGRYQGAFSWNNSYLLPQYDTWKTGFADWNNTINPLASAVRCSYRVTTVSQNYLNELTYDSSGLESLFQSEYMKCVGILNGIDNEIWDPKTDPMLDYRLQKDEIKFKKENKDTLCKKAKLDPALPLYGFIGRLVYEKGAEFIAGLADTWLSRQRNINFVILGTGDKAIENAIQTVSYRHPTNVTCMLSYNEELAHQIYAACDYLLMPSRVEPCGLNQMFAMRYGTLPIVRATGGLKDSVQDVSLEGGVGFTFDDMDFEQMLHGVGRAFDVFMNPKFKNLIVKKAMKKDFSWDSSANKYKRVYDSVL